MPQAALMFATRITLLHLSIRMICAAIAETAARHMLEAFRLAPEGVRNYRHVVLMLYSLRPALKHAADHAMHAWPRRLGLEELTGQPSLSELAADELLLWIVEAHTICDLGLERFFTSLRAALVAAVEQGRLEAADRHVFCSLAAVPAKR
jgi:hypothetical protein